LTEETAIWRLATQWKTAHYTIKHIYKNRDPKFGTKIYTIMILENGGYMVFIIRMTNMTLYIRMSTELVIA
jgi:hypothetical protein